MGYPYCPFVSWEFLQFIDELRGENKNFGLRIHCGENVPFVNANAGAYRHFIAHMYIVFRCLRFLQRKLGHSIRIGHGIAFARILDGSMRISAHRKSSVLLAEIQDHAKHVLSKIAFEVNITSNEYLLGQALRGGNFQQILQLKALYRRRVPIILATDDDGIWPIDHCPSKHPGHHSLVAEYCRAISSGLIQNSTRLRAILQNTEKYRFFSVNGQWTPPGTSNDISMLPVDNEHASTVIFHPDLIKTVLKKCYDSRWADGTFYNAYKLLYEEEKIRSFIIRDPSWKTKCDNLAPIAYVIYSTTEDLQSLQIICDEYDKIFKDKSNLLHLIYQEWMMVRNRFMFPNNVNKGHHIVARSNTVFLSESTHDKSQMLTHLLTYLENENDTSRNIRIFTRQLTHQATKTYFDTHFTGNCASGVTIDVFTTNHKDEYEDVEIGNKRLRLNINKHPTKRTNVSRVQEQHALYVACENASAATAYLHHIGDRIANNEAIGTILPEALKKLESIRSSRITQPIADRENTETSTDPVSTTTSFRN
jgi:hypothetical protein